MLSLKIFLILFFLQVNASTHCMEKPAGMTRQDSVVFTEEDKAPTKPSLECSSPTSMIKSSFGSDSSDDDEQRKQDAAPKKPSYTRIAIITPRCPINSIQNYSEHAVRTGEQLASQGKAVSPEDLSKIFINAAALTYACTKRCHHTCSCIQITNKEGLTRYIPEPKKWAYGEWIDLKSVRGMLIALGIENDLTKRVS